MFMQRRYSRPHDPSFPTSPLVSTPPPLRLTPISIPPSMPSDTKSSPSSSSRLERTLGTNNRAWALLALLAFFYLLSRYTLPSDPLQTKNHFSSVVLHDRNYLNASASEPAPFDFCPVFGPGDPLGQKYNPHAIAKTKLHLGSGARVQRVIHKALSGLPVTISILGGSGKIQTSFFIALVYFKC